MGISILGKFVLRIWSFSHNLKLNIVSNAIHVQSLTKVSRIHVIIRSIIS